MRYIHYVLLGKKTETYQIDSNIHRITINIFTEKDLKNFQGWCGARQHEVYCDNALNRKKYETFVKEILEPELCLKDSNQNIIFI